jgi:pimeloyl-ACP methyl ester carboxylesterase
MAKLDRDGVKIHYEVHGSGPTILLSHGYSSPPSRTATR